jgi:hypothetical protein
MLAVNARRPCLHPTLYSCISFLFSQPEICQKCADQQVCQKYADQLWVLIFHCFICYAEWLDLDHDDFGYICRVVDLIVR